MARIFGQESQYIIDNEKIDRYAAFSYVLFLVVLGLVIINFFFKYIDDAKNLIIILLMLVPMGLIAYHLIKKHERSARSYNRGGRGEEAIFFELRNLSDEFAIFQDVNTGNRGNTDFVVVGPTGIYTIEVKARSGNVGYNKGNLIINSKLTERDYLSQARGETLGLSNFIEKKLGVKIFIQPILVFANYSEMNFGLNQVRGVFVVGKPFLLKLIQAQPFVDFGPVKQRIEKIFLSTIQN